MFNKKHKIDPPLADSPVNSDLIIHNMPSPARFSGSTSGPVSSPAFSGGTNSTVGQDGKPRDNFKTTGLLIMAGGLLFIGVLAYLSYRFIIQPMAEPPVSLVVNTVSGLSETGEDADVVIPPLVLEIASSTDLEAETPLEIEPTSTDTATSTPSDDLPPPPPADSDNDGLSDPEEEVFGTDPLLFDTDGDIFSDAMEISSGYDPRGSGRLSDSILARRVNETFGYEISYPAVWPVQSLSGEATLIFTAPDNSLFQIVAEENTDRSSILNWYEESFPEAELSYGRLQSGAGWEGIMSEDGQNFYLTDVSHGRIIVVSYISAATSPAYPFIFQLMINSLLVR